MHVLLIHGSPHKKGNTYIALSEVASTLEKNDATTEIVSIGTKAIQGCIVPLHKCIDNAIHSAAGIELRLECNRLMQKQGYAEPTGRAKITKGYNRRPAM